MHHTCKYKIRLAKTKSDVRLAQEMRANMFGVNVACRTVDSDAYDDQCQHVLIEAHETGEIHACFRFMHFREGGCVDQSYSAQFYDLHRLKAYGKPMLEIGRFCVSPDKKDQDILRVAWAFLTRYVDEHNISFMFGCSSFEGIGKAKYVDAFALLKDRYLAPALWSPKAKAGEIFEFASQLKDYKPVLKIANKNMPPLLRTYLGMGGLVSDHAVVDRTLGTLHVFTGVEVDAIPAQRVKLLRASVQI